MSAESGISRQNSHLDWEDRRRTTLEAARRRSMVIRMLRISFLVLAAAIIGLVAAYIIRNALHKETPPTPPTVQEDEDVRMINPRFSGRDNAGRPYVVIAETAIRRRDNQEITDLVSPRLDTAPGPGSSHITARRGVYDAAKKKLELFDTVRLNSPNGYQYQTEHARFFIDKDVIEGDQQVNGSGPMGTIRADRYQVFNGDEKVFFLGHVFTHINNNARAKETPNE